MKRFLVRKGTKGRVGASRKVQALEKVKILLLPILDFSARF